MKKKKAQDTEKERVIQQYFKRKEELEKYSEKELQQMIEDCRNKIHSILEQIQK